MNLNNSCLLPFTNKFSQLQCSSDRKKQIASKTFVHIYLIASFNSLLQCNAAKLSHLIQLLLLFAFPDCTFYITMTFHLFLNIFLQL